MATFKSTLIPKYPSLGSKLTPDVIYWKKFGFPFTVKEYGAITHIDFSPVDPYFAATTSTRVQVYNSVSNRIYRNLTRFRVEAYGGTFRQDGKLLVAGDEEGIVRVFDLATKNVLRYFKGHSGPVHKATFLNDNVRVVSFSDDKTIGVWDVPSEQQYGTLTEHKDYIRTGAASHFNPDIFFSGSYDHTVKMFDLRNNSCVLTVDHGSPVEALLAFPSSGLFISSGGVDIKVWDAVAGGRLLVKLSQHYKTVTALCFASEHCRIMSGSLDGHVKIYDVATYQPVHGMTYPSPILSLGIAPDDSTLAVGMADGLLSIQQRKRDILKDDDEMSVQQKDKISYKYMLEAKSYQPEQTDVVASIRQGCRLTDYDKYLKKFKSTKALDHVLKKYGFREPAKVVGVMQELMRRGTLLSAIGGRNRYSLNSLLMFLIKYVRDGRFMKTLIDVANITLDIYSSSPSSCLRVKRSLQSLKFQVNLEIRYMKEIMSLRGTIEILLAAANSKGPKGSNAMDSNFNTHNAELQNSSVL